VSERSALEIAIAIVRFFSIRKSPTPQPDYRMAEPKARTRVPHGAAERARPGTAWCSRTRAAGYRMVQPNARGPDAASRGPDAVVAQQAP